MSDTIISLPQGKLGVTFVGSPPKVNTIQSGSPLKNQLSSGSYVKGLKVPGLEISSFDDSKELTDLLIKYSGLSTRQLTICRLPPSVKPTWYRLTVPAGKLGISLQGTHPTKVTSVKETSPIKDVVRAGMTVETLIIPGKADIVGNRASAEDMLHALKSSFNTPGRILVFQNPTPVALPVAVSSVVNHPVQSTSVTAVVPNYFQHHPNSSVAVENMVDFQLMNDLKVKVQGQESQVVHIKLRPGQTVQSETGTMLYMTGGINMTTDGRGGGGALGRWVTGATMMMTKFTYCGQYEGTVCFAPHFPSKVVAIDLQQHRGMLTCQKGSFLCGGMGMDIRVAYSGSIGTSLFGGEGFILQAITGRGTVFLNAVGAIIEKKLQPGERLRVHTGALLAFERGIQYDIATVRGMGNMFFGGEGMFLTTLTGPGTVWLHGNSIDKIVEQVAMRMPRDRR